MRNPALKTCFLAIGLIISLNAGAKNREGVTKIIKNQYDISPGALLVLNNKFGDITCANWEKNQIAVEVTISVDSRSQETAQRIFDHINIQMKGELSTVQVITSIASGIDGKGHFSIDYNIQMPSSVSLDLTNKFGDVFIADVNGKAAIRLSYGSASIENLNYSDNLLEIGFGSASLGKANSLVTQAEYSTMNIGYAGNIRVTSKYTDIEAGKALAMDGNFEGGQITLGVVSVFSGTLKFTNLAVEVLEQKFDLRNQFGNVEVDEVKSGFSEILVENKFGSVEIDLPSASSYTVDVQTHFGSITFRHAEPTFTYRNVSEQDQTYKGAVGANPSGKVKIRNEFGNIVL